MGLSRNSGRTRPGPTPGTGGSPRRKMAGDDRARGGKRMSQRPLVGVTDHLVVACARPPSLQDVAELRLLGPDGEADIIRQGGQADVLLVYHTIKISRQALEALPRLRAVIRCGVGFDNIDVESAGRRGVVVCN